MFDTATPPIVKRCAVPGSPPAAPAANSSGIRWSGLGCASAAPGAALQDARASAQRGRCTRPQASPQTPTCMLGVLGESIHPCCRTSSQAFSCMVVASQKSSQKPASMADSCLGAKRLVGVSRHLSSASASPTRAPGPPAQTQGAAPTGGASSVREGRAFRVNGGGGCWCVRPKASSAASAGARVHAPSPPRPPAHQPNVVPGGARAQQQHALVAQRRQRLAHAHVLLRMCVSACRVNQCWCCMCTPWSRSTCPGR